MVAELVLLLYFREIFFVSHCSSAGGEKKKGLKGVRFDCV